MLPKSQTALLRICGSCKFAKKTLGPHEVQKLKRMAHFKFVLRRYPNPLRDTEVFCPKEDIEVGVLEEACAFWRRK